MKKAVNTGHKQLLLHVTDVDWDYEIQRIIGMLRSTGARLAYIDLFCGAGGTSTGIEKAMHFTQKIACVILGINHDKVAIQSHQANHPETLHLVEDVREVNLVPIARLVEAIRMELPEVKIVLWASAECTNHSKAKGGDSRDADSRSLPEELYRYIQSFRPDLIQIENVIEFRIWCRLRQKNLNHHYDKKGNKYNVVKPFVDVTKYAHKVNHAAHGRLYSMNGTKWYAKDGRGFSKDSEKGIVAWLIPDKRYIVNGEGEYFIAWREHIKELGYELYGDKNINSAEVGAYTARTRYFGQFSLEMPLAWPAPTHAKFPDKVLSMYGKLKPFKAVREVLDLTDTGESIFDANRKKAITSKQTYRRVLQGCIKFVPGGKENYEQFLIKFNCTDRDGSVKHSVSSIDNPAGAVTAQHRTGKVDVSFITSYHAGSGRNEDRTHSIDEPARTLDTQNRFALTQVVEVVPFLVQYNNNCDGLTIDAPIPPVLTKDKFAITQTNFIHASNGGTPSAKISSVDAPARTILAGENKNLVDVEQILPFISMYYGNGHNCHSVDGPSPTIMSADNSAIVKPEPFIMRYFTSGGGQHNDINGPAGGMTTVPKMHLVSPEEIQWIMNPSYNNVGASVDEPAHTILAGRKHAYLLNPQFQSKGSSVDAPSPTVIAGQDKKPMHLVQVEMADESFFGIVIYAHDCEEMRELKRFMAANGIVDIKMRMLNVRELLRIQGFPKDYILKGSQTDQKKFVGNSVEVTTAMKLAECYGEYLFANENVMAV